MMSGAIRDLLSRGRAVELARPWPRTVADEASWAAATACLGRQELTLAGLWAEPDVVHMALLCEASGEIGVLSCPAQGGGFPSVGAQHAPAIRLERAIRDLCGLEPRGAPDARPWIDHGRWGVRRPLSSPEPAGAPEPYAFLAANGEGLHQIAVGPIHAGIIEPGHFRFHANGETVVRLEERLGYVHRGLEGLMAGAPLERAAKLAGRASGDSTIAYSIAFARAVEAAAGVDVPVRAHWLRALMAELERLANHLGDIGAVCNDAAFALMHAHCGVLREKVLRASRAVFGHRLMMDQVVPGGVVSDPDPGRLGALRTLTAELGQRFPLLVSLYDDTASLLERTVGTGVVSPELALRFGAGGFVGRAAGRPFDARRALAYEPYDELSFETPLREDGDVNARVWIRIEEVRQSLGLIEQMLDRAPDGPTRGPLEPCAGEGLALVEGFRGDILAWVRIDDAGRVERCHLRDPSWFQWPLLEACIEGAIVADFPLCNKSFNCSYAGHDL
jgi:Ni,Fe-hydrogenase III large subunit